MTDVNTTATSTARTNAAKCSHADSRWPRARRIRRAPACSARDESCSRGGDGCEQRFRRRVLDRERAPQLGFHLAPHGFPFGLGHRMECYAQALQFFDRSLAFFRSLATLVASRLSGGLDDRRTEIVRQFTQAP